MRLFTFVLFYISLRQITPQFIYDPRFDAKKISVNYPTRDSIPWDDETSYYRTIGDLNGDKRPDIVGFGDGVWGLLGCSQGFADPAYWTVEHKYGRRGGFNDQVGTPRFVIDFNNDGLADIIGRSYWEIIWSINNGTNINTDMSVLQGSDFVEDYYNQYRRPTLFGDVNGDGYQDLVYFSLYAGGFVYVGLGNGTALTSSSVWSTDINSNNGWSGLDERPLFLADVNGDGKDDVVGFGDNGVAVALSTGSSFDAFSIWLNDFHPSNGWTDYSQHPRGVGDFDGDGKADVIGFKNGVWVALSQGSSFQSATLWYNGLSADTGLWNNQRTWPRLFADMNCDNKTDLVTFAGNGDGIKVYLSQTTQDFCPNISTNCELCLPGNTSCTLCSPFPLYLYNNTCTCPPGYTIANSSSICNNSYPLIIELNTSDCENLQFNHFFAEEEVNFYSRISVTWNISSSSTNLTRTNFLRNYLGAIHERNFTIPRGYFDTNEIYYIESTRLSLLGEILPITYEFFVTSMIFFVDYRNFSTCYFFREMQNNITADIDNTTKCAQNAAVIWEKVSGPPIDNTKVSFSGFKIMIQPCTFPENETIVYRVSAYDYTLPDFKNYKYYHFGVPVDELAVRIIDGDRYQDYNKSLTVTAIVSSRNLCPLTSPATIYYVWTCTKTSRVTGITACPDPDSLYGQYMISNVLILPKKYLEQRSRMDLVVTVVREGRTAQDKTTFNITSNKTLVMELICETSSCLKYNPDVEYTLNTKIYNDPGTGYGLDWFVSSTEVTLVTNFKQLKFFGPAFPINSGELQIKVFVQSAVYDGSASFSFPINNPPLNGSLVIDPPNGISFNTLFTLTAADWQDDDIPLSYQFFYTYNQTTNAITHKQAFNYVTTFLPGDNPSADVVVFLYVSDRYGATTTVNKTVAVLSNYDSFVSSVNSASSVVNTLSPSSLNTVINTAIIAHELKNSQHELTVLRNRLVSCQDCTSGDTRCINGTCLCYNSTNDVKNCSITSIMLQANEDLSIKIIEKINQSFAYIDQNPSSFTSTEVNTLKDSALSTLNSMSADPYFGTLEVQNQIYGVMQGTLEVLNAQKPLSKPQSDDVFNIISNSYQYSTYSDCGCSGNTCLRLENITKTYFEKVSIDTLKEKIAGEAPNVVRTKTFDIATTKSTDCDIAKETLTTSSYSPSISFVKLSDKKADCDREMDVYYYSFPNRSMVWNCSLVNSGIERDVVMIKMVDSRTRASLIDKYSIVVKMPNELDCPRKCYGEYNNSCFCSPSLFDVGDQITLLFRSSNFGLLGNIGAIASWVWYSSPIFWVNVGLLVWYLGSLWIIKKTKLRKYCIMEKIDNLRHLNTCQGLIALYVVNSNLFNILFLRRDKVNKVIRSGIYYLRLVLYGAFSAIFTGTGTEKGLTYLLQNLKIYAILLPYFTVIPLTAILSSFIKKSSKRYLRQSKNKFIDAKNFVATIIVMILVALCLLGMFIIAANKSNGMQLEWVVILVMSVIQDFIAAPIISITIKYGTVLVYEYAMRKKKTNLIQKVQERLDANMNVILAKMKGEVLSSKIVEKNENDETRNHLKNENTDDEQEKMFGQSSQEKRFSKSRIDEKKPTLRIIKEEDDENNSKFEEQHQENLKNHCSILSKVAFHF